MMMKMKVGPASENEMKWEMEKTVGIKGMDAKLVG